MRYLLCATAMRPARASVKPSEIEAALLSPAECRPERSAPVGAERDIPKNRQRTFTGVDAACPHPGAKRSRKAFRVLGRTGLNGP